MASDSYDQLFNRMDSESAPFVLTPKKAQDASWLRSLAVLLEHRRVLLIVPTIATVVVALALYLGVDRRYATPFSFTPAAISIPGGSLATLAGQFGVNLPGSDPSASPDFYAELLQTRELLEPLARTRWTFPFEDDTIQGTLTELYDIDEGDPAESLAETIRLLRSELIRVDFDRQTSIVNVRIETRWASLSFQLADSLLGEVDAFNRQSRQTQASAERDFIAQQVDTARHILRMAENAVEAFLKINRSFQNDPALFFEHDRLMRELGLRQTVYTMLVQSFEQARAAAVRSTPSISIVEQPRLALRAERRYIALKALVSGVFFAFVFAIGLLTKDATEDSATHHDDAGLARLRLAWTQTREDLVPLLAPLKGRWRSRS